ncbi:MAG TPA: response regulator transcription factor [Candidatus Angelobacter sp.]
MNTRGDNSLEVVVIAASSPRRSILAGLMARSLDVSVTTSAAISSQNTPESAADVIVVDVDNAAVANAVIKLAEALPAGSGLIALIDNPVTAWVTKAIHAGINAILSREVTSEELQLAVQAVEAGLVLLHPSSARTLPIQNLPIDLDSPSAEPLTPREREVLRLASDGLGNKEIAVRLNISEHTVKFHVSSILGKLGAATRAEAVSQGIRKGMLII